MRKNFILFAILAFLASCSSGTGYKLKGVVDIPEAEGTYVYVQEVKGRDINVLDSALITDGKFELLGDAENVLVRYISLDPQVAGRLMTQVVLEPGNINVVVEQEKISVSGTKLNDALAAHEAKLGERQVEMREISQKFQSASQEGTMTPELEEELVGQYNKIYEELTASTVDFIKANIGNELGKFMFATNAPAYEPEVQEEILAMADEAYKSREDIQKIIEKLENAKKVAIGQPFLDFTMKDPAGNEVSLSDYAGKGKVVLIDFWAAWCGPCRQEMPNVVNAYKDFKDKGFEIVGVSLDRDQESWEKGLADLNMTWPQMSDLKFWDTPVVNLYAFRGIPHTVLLDGEGNIIAKDLRGSALHDKLAELLN